MTSLRARLLAAFAYVVALVIVALAVPFALSVSSRVEAEVQAQAAADAHLVAAAAAGALDRPAELRALVARAGADARGRVLVVAADGTVLADSEAPELAGADYGGRPEVAAVLAGSGIEQGRRRSESLGADLLYTAVPVLAGGARAGAVRITRSAAPVDARVRRDVLAVAGIAAAALVLGLVLAWLLAGSLARPLRGLAAAARRVGEGDLDARAPVAGAAEQREVASAFNDMADRLGRALRAQREFVGNASHQLRTPLTGLRLRLEAAALKADDPPLAEELAAAEREAERLGDLVAALLALAREGDERAPQPVDLAGAAERAAERWRPEGGGRVAVGAGGRLWAAASADDVAIVLDNLLENALRYTDGPVDLGWRRDGGLAVLEVLDRGPGVEPEEAERLFGRFVRGGAPDAPPGSGLGLAVVRTLARRWGGDAALEPRPGGGTRAWVALPLAAAPAGVRETEPVA